MIDGATLKTIAPILIPGLAGLGIAGGINIANRIKDPNDGRGRKVAGGLGALAGGALGAYYGGAKIGSAVGPAVGLTPAQGMLAGGIGGGLGGLLKGGIYGGALGSLYDFLTNSIRNRAQRSVDKVLTPEEQAQFEEYVDRLGG
jgi:hypothetical protein